MNILISAYACEPLKGSEPGVGWNLSVALTKYCHVYVVTRLNNKEVIEKYLINHPIENITFLYHDFPSYLLKTKKIIGTQMYYLLWNITMIGKVKKWIKQFNIDIVHHLTFNQYRTPSPGYFCKIPFVVGPIGGAEVIDKVFDCELEPATLRRENYRRKGYDFSLLKWLCKRNDNKKLLVFSAKENKKRLETTLNIKGVQTQVLPSIAIHQEDFPSFSNEHSKMQTFTMIYAGRALDWKGLHIFLVSLSSIIDRIPKVKVKLIGIRSESEKIMVEKWIYENCLNDCVELINFMPRPELIKNLQDANLFIYPAFRDSGSMSVLEACAYGCPSICFNAGGQDAFPDNVILKVNIGSDYESTKQNFANSILWAVNHEQEIKVMGERAQTFTFSELTWEKKAEQFKKMYEQLIKNT